MFAANVVGTVQRVIYDNGKPGKDAQVKVVLSVSKRFAKDKAESKIFPLFVLWGFDADYFRKYIGKGQPVAFMDCELEIYKNEKKLDQDDNPIEQHSYRVGKLSAFNAAIGKALVEAGVAEEAEGGDDDDDDDDRSRRRRSSDSRSNSRSSRRSRDEDDEDERPRSSSRRRSSSRNKDDKPKGSNRRRRDEDDDDNYFDEDED